MSKYSICIVYISHFKVVFFPPGTKEDLESVKKTLEKETEGVCVCVCEHVRACMQPQLYVNTHTHACVLYLRECLMAKISSGVHVSIECQNISLYM